MSLPTPQATTEKSPIITPVRKLVHGWHPDLPDHRDFKLFFQNAAQQTFPPSMDLRHGCPPVYDQGELGSCTGNAIAAAMEFEQMKQKESNAFMPSRLFIYYSERVTENTIASDAGAQIRDGIKSVGNVGVCPESVWPYDVTKFAVQPSPEAYAAAKKMEALRYDRLPQNAAQFKACLAAHRPFVFGFTVYSAFEGQDVADTGILNLPAKGESSVGGHAVLCVGYDDKTQRFLVRNSWGSDWGQQGYFTMPYAYMTNPSLASDFWTITQVS